jgi:hypothetical protein
MPKRRGESRGTKKDSLCSIALSLDSSFTRLLDVEDYMGRYAVVTDGRMLVDTHRAEGRILCELAEL